MVRDRNTWNHWVQIILSHLNTLSPWQLKLQSNIAQDPGSVMKQMIPSSTTGYWTYFLMTHQTMARCIWKSVYFLPSVVRKMSHFIIISNMTQILFSSFGHPQNIRDSHFSLVWLSEDHHDEDLIKDSLYLHFSRI